MAFNKNAETNYAYGYLWERRPESVGFYQRETCRQRVGRMREEVEL